MTAAQWKQAEAQLPTGATITRTYAAFENGETRLAVKLPGVQYETRYIAHLDGENVRLEHRP
jgi:hypothetical protein